MNRRRSMSSLHRETRLRALGVLPPLPQREAAEMPFERIPVKELDKAGVALLPKAEEETHFCFYGCGSTADTNSRSFPYCSDICAANAQGDR